MCFAGSACESIEATDASRGSGDKGMFLIEREFVYRWAAAFSSVRAPDNEPANP
jgi:hypothetical protein